MTTKIDKLSEYKSKRSESKTPEPFTSTVSNPNDFAFVVQKHQATALHFDFRLEVGGVMPSWAVPKGPTLDNTLKRLALKTEDHPLDYRHFEGHIPEGEYGAGRVMVWDEGIYIPEIEVSKGVREEIKDKNEGEKIMEEGINKGEIKFRLLGKKLKGSFALVKTRGFGSKKDNTWLLIKHKDEYVIPKFDAKEDNISAKTGKKFEEI